ncbi:MAG: hypothetical protein H5T98_09300 [Syntrophomonadaceae bacterium]|nr:hypothetical protein [Syntrophomonadaceae bacterium]
MSAKLRITFQKVNEEDPGYQWLNIELGEVRVGKARIKQYHSKIIIHTINIFPEFERKGFAKQTVDFLKEKVPEIIAERVRPTARGFWKHLDFYDTCDGNYRWVSSRK